MSRIVINEELCIGCGACVRECTAHNLRLHEGKAQSLGKDCFECGHCFAVCPMQAVEMPDYDCSQSVPASQWEKVEPRKLLSLMRARRSVRYYTDEPVSEEDLQMILEAARACPTACNLQDVHFTVIKDVPAVDKLAMTYPKFGSGSVSDDSFFNGAPLVILISANRVENAMIASAYMELMIASLDLGALYSGYFKNTVRGNPELKKELGVPEDKEPFTCLVIGHPAVSFRRTPPRKPAAVNVL